MGSWLSWGRGTPIYGIYKNVPRDKVWVLKFSGITFASFDNAFPAQFLDRVPKINNSLGNHQPIKSLAVEASAGQST